MRITDQRYFIQDSLKHEAVIKEQKIAEKKHDLKVENAIEEELRIRKNRQASLIEHEEDNKKNLEARNIESDQYHAYLLAALNII